jgi:hypothetical protein
VLSTWFVYWHGFTWQRLKQGHKILKKIPQKNSKFGSPRLFGLPTKLHQVKHVNFFYHFQIENLAVLANSNPRQSNTFIFYLYIYNNLWKLWFPQVRIMNYNFLSKI